MPSHGLLRIASVLLLFIGIAFTANGIMGAWRGSDSDYRARAVEYSSYAEGVYPNRRISIPGRERAPVHSVYLPYAFPMMKVFFWMDHAAVQRITIESLSLAAFIALAWQSRAAFAAHGIALAPWQALALPLAFSGNSTAFSQGQFTIPCMGLLALQVMLQQKNKPAAAGLCWALAMIKPHLALPFAMLFPLQRQWRGLVWGGLLLAFLSAWALWRTGVSWSAFLSAGPALEKMSFVNTPYAAGLWIAWTGTPPRTASAIGIGISLLATAAAGSPWLRARLPLMPAAGLSGLLAFVLFYHRHYDNLLLFPLLAVTLAHCLARPRVPALAITMAFAATALLPASLMLRNEILTALTLLTPIAAGSWLWTGARRKEWFRHPQAA